MTAESLTTGVSLAELYSQREFAHANDVCVSSCCNDHLRCRPGDLFVALVQAEQDGHNFAEIAVQRGATAILTERLLPINVPQCIVPSTKAAQAELCQRLAGSPSQNIPVIGIAGRSGVTSTNKLLTSMFNVLGHSPAYFGAYGYSDGIEYLPRMSKNTSSAQYARWLANIVLNGCTHAITEIPEPDALNSVHMGTELQTLILTSFSSATHDKKCTPAARTYLDRAISLVKKDGLIVANVDCPVLAEAVSSLDRPVLTVSTTGRADVTASLIEQCPSEQVILLSAGSDTAVVRTRIIGESHMQNCLLAAAAGLGMGYELETIVGGIEAIDQIPGNLERIECGQPFSVFVDTASSASELRQTLRTVRKVTRGRVICMLGQGDADNTTQMQTQSLRAQRGRIAERGADSVVITSDDAADNSPLHAAHDILDGFSDVARPQVIPNRIRAIEWALSQAKPGDTVLLAGPHNALPTTQSEETDADASELFPDALIAKYWLFNLAPHLETTE